MSQSLTWLYKVLATNPFLIESFDGVFPMNFFFFASVLVLENRHIKYYLIAKLVGIPLNFVAKADASLASSPYSARGDGEWYFLLHLEYIFCLSVGWSKFRKHYGSSAFLGVY